MVQKVVLITGCSSGIGLALVAAFRKRGCHVVATARNVTAIGHLAADGVRVDSLDVNDQAAVCRVLERIREREGRLDIVINNAGFGLFGPILEMPADLLDLQFKTHVFSPLFLCRASVFLLQQSGCGIMVFIGSVAAEVPTPFAGAYCASKAALHAMADVMRMEAAALGIRVVTVKPGAIGTRFAENAGPFVTDGRGAGSRFGFATRGIRKRSVSSNVWNSPPEAMAERIAGKILSRKPPAEIRYGRGSLALLFMRRILPLSFLDFVFGHLFHLKKWGG